MKISDLFEGKGSKEEAGYIPRPKNGEKCINCTMWRDPNKCTAVAGDISPNGWCEWYAGGAYGKRGKRVTESLGALSQWKNEEPVDYVKQLTKFFKAPDELTHKRAVWYNKDGFKRIEVLDEYILHSSPVPHYDYVYSYVDIKVPHDLADDLAKSSESILIDHLKGEVGGRCASLSANAVTIQYVIDVVEGNVKPSKQEYEKRIKSMKKMFADGKRYELDWWPDVTGDADPKNKYYKESKEIHIKEDGRIVKGVNTTVDVGPNEIKTQAAKFGNTVDKDGRPPTMSKAVKGKSTNVLYNLGLSESSIFEALEEAWSAKYKRSINCNNPKGFSQKAHCAGRNKNEDQHPNEKPVGPEFKPTMPKGTIRVKVSDVYDWYKLGQHISDLEGLGKHDFGKGPPEAVISFGSEEEEHKYIELIKKLGLEIFDVDPGRADAPGVETDPTYNTENFADGKKPGRKGLSKRVGIPKGASVTQLRKIAKNSTGERRRMAHWQANMKSGRKKK